MLAIRKTGAGEEHLPASRGAIQINRLCGLAIKRNLYYASVQIMIAQDINSYA
jgi:hypothetical protein